MTASSMSQGELAVRLVGGVWGHLVGDAVGVPYEFRPSDAIGAVQWGETGTHRQLPGTWSDDGALMLALLDSLTAEGVDFDVEDQGRRALAWRRDGAYTPDGTVFDIGNTTRQALHAIEAGSAAANAGPADIDNCGNGSLMRILPIALVGRDLVDGVLIEQARAASKVTHGHPRAQVACALYVLTAVRLLKGWADPQGALDDSIEVLRASITDEAEMVAALDHLLGWTERQGRGRVWDSFWSAWDAFAEATSYQQTIERAIAYGNDTDTTAAIAGGLAGVHWGIDAIPSEWLTGMRGRDVAVPLVDRLLATAGWKTSTSRPLRVDWVPLERVPELRDAAEGSGRLGMTFLPGKQRDGWTGLHWRDLETDVARLGDEYRVDDFLLLVEDPELEAARVSNIADVMATHGINLIRYPIRDMDVTDDRRALRIVLDGVLEGMRGGKSVVVACRGGLGRTGTIVACLLRDGGLYANDAIRFTRETRHNTIERGCQVQFVREWGVL